MFAFAAPGAAAYSRKQLDELTEKAKSHGARGAYFVKLAAEGTTSTVEKLIGAENVKKLAEACGAKTGDLVVAVSAKEEIKGTEAAALVAGQLRLQLGRSAGRDRQDAVEIPVADGFSACLNGASPTRPG